VSLFAKAGLFGKQSTSSAEVYLNLTPLMDVMSNILFFLLSAFGASIIAVLPATVPARSSSESSIAAESDKVTVTLRADAAGFALACESQTEPTEALLPFNTHIPRRDTGFDYDGLRNALTRVKKRWPGSTTMILMPDDDIRYEGIAEIMDAAREVALPDGRAIVLFPDVVLSTLVR
jgi:biopolymer transport protein ExbD